MATQPRQSGCFHRGSLPRDGGRYRGGAGAVAARRKGEGPGNDASPVMASRGVARWASSRSPSWTPNLDDAPIEGADEPQYAVAIATSSDLGLYRVEITNTCGTVVSDEVLIDPARPCP